MRLFVLAFVLAAATPVTATVWDASPNLSPQSTHGSLQVTVSGSNGPNDVTGTEVVLRAGWGSDQACTGCVSDGVLTADAEWVGLPNPGLAIQTITMAVTLQTLDITLDSPNISTVAQVSLDHFLGVWTNTGGAIPADSFPHDRPGQWSFHTSGSALIEGVLLSFDYDYLAPELAVAQNLVLGSDSFEMSGMLFGSSSGPLEVLLGTVAGVEYSLALTPGFGTEQFFENPNATIVPEPSIALLLGLGLIGLSGARSGRSARQSQ